MKIFDPTSHTRSRRHQELYAFFALAYTLVDFAAALLFIIGSVLFFRASTTYLGTWLFFVGSVFFGLRPTIMLLREFAYIRAGRYEEVTLE